MEDRLDKIEGELREVVVKLDHANRTIEKLVDVIEKILDGGAGVPMEAVMPDYGATSTAVDSSEFFGSLTAKKQLKNLLERTSEYDEHTVNVIIESINPALMQQAYNQVDKQGISGLSMFINVPMP